MSERTSTSAASSVTTIFSAALSTAVVGGFVVGAATVGWHCYLSSRQHRSTIRHRNKKKDSAAVGDGDDDDDDDDDPSSLLASEGRVSRPPIVVDINPYEFMARALQTEGPVYLLATARALHRRYHKINTTKKEDDATIAAFQFPTLRILPFLRPLFELYVIGDYRLARTVLEHTQSTKPHLFYKFFNDCLGGDGFMSANGVRAMHARKSVAPAFAPHRVTPRMTEIIAAAVREWMEQHGWFLDNADDTSREDRTKILDMHAEMLGLTTDVIGRVGFGDCYRMTPQQRRAFERDLQTAMEIHYYKTNPFKQTALTAWMFPDLRRARRATDRMLAVAYRMLESYRASKRKEQNARDNDNDDDSDENTTILARIANNPDYDNDRQRATDILTFFFAGYETTASALGWTFLELARHPAEQQRLRRVLLLSSSANDDGDGDNGMQQQQQQRKAVQNVTREILRLHTPAALGSMRQLPVDVVVPDDDDAHKKNNRQQQQQLKVIPAGAMCILPYYVILRDGRVFDNPDEFVPSRWEQPTPDMLRAFLPFAAGRRNCVGMALAQAELHGIVAELVRHLQFDVIDPGRARYFVTLQTRATILAVRPIRASSSEQ